MSRMTEFKRVIKNCKSGKNEYELIKMGRVEIKATMEGDVEGGVFDESGFYFMLEKDLANLAQNYGLESVIDSVRAAGPLSEPIDLFDKSLDPFDAAWNTVRKEEGSFPDGTPRFDYSKPVSEEQNVQRLHKLLSMATSVAEELGLDHIESEIVSIQEELEYHHPGSEARYYGYSS